MSLLAGQVAATPARPACAGCKPTRDGRFRCCWCAAASPNRRLTHELAARSLRGRRLFRWLCLSPTQLQQLIEQIEPERRALGGGQRREQPSGQFNDPAPQAWLEVLQDQALAGSIPPNAPDVRRARNDNAHLIGLERKRLHLPSADGELQFFQLPFEVVYG